MNLKSILYLILSISLRGALGGSYSQVYVQNAANNPPGYVAYGPPAVYSNAKYARLSGPALVPVPSMTDMLAPCVSPCIITNPNIPPVANNAKIIAYNAPNVPVVAARSKDNGYEYSYVVYDENTGDQKAQRETSDGSVVRGEYSFIQPDGYVREVQYTADDLTGFNVVVKRIPPESVNAGENKTPSKGKSEPAPCADIKKEDLKVESEQPKDNVELNEVDFVPTTIEPAAANEKAEETTVIVTTAEVIQTPEQTSQPDDQPETVAIVTPVETQATVQKITEAPAAPLPSNTNILVSYDDIIRCIQSSIQRGSLQSGFSPLTYIILPGKPC